MLLIALALSSLVQASEDPARRAIERSLPYLEREGVAWIEKRACLSCHHVPFLLWSFRELAYFLIWRDLKLRYKQTLLGASWAVIYPFVTTIVFTP